MDIVIHGFDSERIAWLKDSCANADWIITESQNADEAHIVISDKFFDPVAYIDFLKLHKGKRFILPPGISKNVIQNIVLVLKEEHPESKQSIMPPALLARYCDSIYEKIGILDSLTKKIDNENLKSIRGEIHKIAGSAGSFGYPEMTVLSRNIEQILIPILEGRSNLSQEELLRILTEYQNSLKLAFQNILHI